MTLTLSQYRTRVLELLDDTASARYTTAQIDAALRSALVDYSVYRPIPRTYQADTTGDRVIVLPSDFVARQITRVQLWSSDPNQMMDLIFIARQDDEQWSIEIKDAIYYSGYYLTITYSDSHTIDGLDSATTTTIDDDNLICTGAAGYAAQSRAVSRAETINLQPAVTKQLTEMANNYLAQFRRQLPIPRGITMAAFGEMSL